MALISASDVKYSLIKEVTFGVTPTEDATRYELPVSADQAPLTATATDIASPTKRPNRAGNGSRRGAITVDGSFDIRFMRHGVIDTLFESAMSNTFTANVLKAGIKDSSFSVLATLQEGVAGSAMVEQFGGCMVSGFTISAKAGDEVTSSWDLIGASKTNLDTDNVLTVSAVTGVTEFLGAEVNNITVAGQTLSIAELTFETKLDRQRRPYLTSSESLAYGVNGTRETTVTVKAYRESFDIDAAISGLAQAVTFDIGTAGDGYRFQLPAAYGSVPKTTLSDGSAFVEITFKAGYDNTAGTDVVITKL